MSLTAAKQCSGHFGRVAYLPLLLLVFAAQVGCGAGNSVFPLLDINPQSYVYACDFSPRAVELVKAHPAYTVKGAFWRLCAALAPSTQRSCRRSPAAFVV